MTRSRHPDRGGHPSEGGELSDTGITVEDLKTQLRDVWDAMRASVRTAETVNRPGLNYTRVSFPELRRRETDLIFAIRREGGGLMSALDVSGIGSESEAEWDK